ncbi:MAG: hypothetical protein PWR19_2031 [Carnobacterium sp.]|uniref:nucleotidyl transferase AbiEii/AbiGii toxin family protein n=1 Tax=Carnobacterium sp. TaxID=48221 RepID=UPI002649330D|nr:nucleotidyl transferase AbiEii/AbiGii toxin family protein [Carnobacterium sp.]MDN5372985.1 hypothetical protein [Carnobacterium sp.]
MNLHKNKQQFKEIVGAVAAELNFEEFQIEKDYYVSLLLKQLVEVSPEIVFKGGTSLSKCYDVINRFSEDIDINLYVEDKVGNQQKKKLKKDVIEAVTAVGFELLNDKINPPLETRSRRDFNKYLASYQREFIGGIHMVDHIIVETNVTYRAFPCKIIPVSNYITKYLMNHDEEELIEKFNLEPFDMKVQTIDRTFIDKIFAICDYYEDGVYDRYSRHLYDIHMIWKSEFAELEGLKKLIPEIIKIRKPGKNTHSCKPGYPLILSLNKILDKKVYKRDFETNTKEFLSKEASYTEVEKSLKEIITSGLLPEIIE